MVTDGLGRASMKPEIKCVCVCAGAYCVCMCMCICMCVRGCESVCVSHYWKIMNHQSMNDDY